MSAASEHAYLGVVLKKIKYVRCTYPTVFEHECIS